MRLHGLSWRVGLPFLLLVLAETVTLAIYMRSQVHAQERERLEGLAETSLGFVNGSSLPLSQTFADNLRRVTGSLVFVHNSSGIEPTPTDPELRAALPTVAADGRAHQIGRFDIVAAESEVGETLILVREPGDTFWDPRTVRVLAAFWLLAVAFAWFAVRGLVRPLRSLAAQLPDIESDAPPEVPEAGRDDEIGDLARSFLRTRDALREERELRASIERVATLGRMTASLAHEVQNPVAAIKLHAQLLRGTASDDAARTIEQEAARIEGLLNQWLFLSRPEPPATSAQDLGELVARTVAANRARFEHASVAVELDCSGNLTAVCDGKRLGHVFENLVTNAIQAMPAGGTLRIEVQGDDETVSARFADTGAGFSVAALARFGEFFYSEREGGMGIGLGVAREILEAHGGGLSAENLDGGGACVTARLRRRPPEPAIAADERA
ncbi:MAG: HAMP domain-containing histidine kinase [Planctomycetes bacterium]|nr:HAMP domain-containing histidine kinase [Planctomycetota bacterium]